MGPHTLPALPPYGLSNLFTSLFHTPRPPIPPSSRPPQLYFCRPSLWAGFSPVSLHIPFLPQDPPVPSQYLADPHPGFSLGATSSEPDPLLPALGPHPFQLLSAADLSLSHQPRTSQTRHPFFLIHYLTPQHLRLYGTMGGGQYSFGKGIRGSVPYIAKVVTRSFPYREPLWGDLPCLTASSCDTILSSHTYSC